MTLDRKHFRVWYIGTHGTGKSGEAHALAAASFLRGVGQVHVIQEYAREVARGRLNEKTTFDVQQRILLGHFVAEQDLAEDYHVISDRAVCNKMYPENKFSGQREYSARLRFLDEVCDQWMSSSPPDVAFVTRIFTTVDALAADPDRSPDVSFQKAIQDRLLRYLDQKKDAGMIQFPLVCLPTEFPEAWPSLCEALCYGDIKLYRPIEMFNGAHGQLESWLSQEKEKHSEPFLAKYLPKG